MEALNAVSVASLSVDDSRFASEPPPLGEPPAVVAEPPAVVAEPPAVVAVEPPAVVAVDAAVVSVDPLAVVSVEAPSVVSLLLSSPPHAAATSATEVRTIQTFFT
jgi:hypothetical protein